MFTEVYAQLHGVVLVIIRVITGVHCVSSIPFLLALSSGFFFFPFFFPPPNRHHLDRAVIGNATGLIVPRS